MYSIFQIIKYITDKSTTLNDVKVTFSVSQLFVIEKQIESVTKTEYFTKSKVVQIYIIHLFKLINATSWRQHDEFYNEFQIAPLLRIIRNCNKVKIILQLSVYTSYV